MRQRDKDEHRLAQQPFPFAPGLVVKVAAVLQLVGEFYQHHAHVVPHCQEHSLEVLRLLAFRCGCRAGAEYLFEIHKALHKPRNLVVEQGADVIDRILRIAGYVVQEGGAD